MGTTSNTETTTKRIMRSVKQLFILACPYKTDKTLVLRCKPRLAMFYAILTFIPIICPLLLAA